MAWYRDHEPWWRAARGGDWDAYYARQYAERLATSSGGGAGSMSGGGSRQPTETSRAG